MVYKMAAGQRPCCAKPLPCVYGLWALRHQSRLRVDDLCIIFPFYMSLCGSVIVATTSRSSSLNSSRSPSVITPSLIIRQMIGRGSDPLMEICTPAQRLSSRMRLHNSQTYQLRNRLHATIRYIPCSASRYKPPAIRQACFGTEASPV